MELIYCQLCIKVGAMELFIASYVLEREPWNSYIASYVLK